MIISERDMVAGEIGALEELLRDMAPNRSIERNGFEKRLARAKERLAELSRAPQAKSMAMTFRGAPVQGQRSIAAAFAGEALKAFTDATRFVASSLIAPLKDTGSLPSAPDEGLRIVGTTVGSFGFELELPLPETAQSSLFPEEEPYEVAVRTTLAVLRSAGAAGDEGVAELAENVAEIQPRAVNKIREFAELLVKSSAGFAAELDGQVTRLNVDVVRRVVEALGAENVGESTLEERGTITGILPAARRFECVLQDGRALSGKLDRGILDATEFKHGWEEKDATLLLREVRVRQSRRFVLVDAKEPG